LHAQGPGDLTRWMGLPWQADTGFCRSGYAAAGYRYDPFVPTFWPARVPNQILTEPNYLIVIDAHQPRDRRLAAFNSRMVWTDPLIGDTAGQMLSMVNIFGAMGLVEVRDGVPGDTIFPPTMMVASFGPGVGLPPPPSAAPIAGPPEAYAEHPREILQKQAIRAAGWESAEQAEQAPRPVRHQR
jgi:hypothetical protein